MVSKTIIKQALLDLQNTLKTETDSDTAIDKWASLMSDIISDAILSADVQPGIPVATTGTAAAQTGATTSTGSLI